LLLTSEKTVSTITDAINLGMSILAQILHSQNLCRWYAALEYVTCPGYRYVHLWFRPDRDPDLQGKSLSLALPFGLHATSHSKPSSLMELTIYFTKT
jgi:hypothetical protein